MNQTDRPFNDHLQLDLDDDSKMVSDIIQWEPSQEDG